MLSLDFIRENKEKAQKGIRNKGSDVDIAHVLELDEKWRSALQNVEQLRAERNLLSDVLAGAQGAERKARLAEADTLKKKLKTEEQNLQLLEDTLGQTMQMLPNVPFDEVPVGKDENDNKVLREVGKRPNFKFKPKDYLEIAQAHDLIDVERAAKVSGSRFGYLTGEAALLEFALVRFSMDTLLKEGFTPIIPPVLVQHEIMKKLGYLAKDPDDVYYLEKDNLNLVGTAEQSIVPMFMDETLESDELPKRFVGFSSAFRREAGSYGKDTRGILRVHQFDKVEMVSFTTPEKSNEEHERMLALQEKLMSALGIPYRVVHICTGDMGFVAANQFDIESWIPSEGRYRETHSTSNATDFQARRLNTRYKAEGGSTFIHILNGTAFAIGRTLIALIENHQTEKGGVNIPKALQPYCGFKKIT